MKFKLKPILTELIWLALSALLTIFLTICLLDWTIFKGSIDIPLHDTYFVFSSWHALLPLFLAITFVIYFFKEKQKYFSRRVPNWIIFISGLLLVIAFTLIIKVFSDFSNATTGGWTAYPPLSVIQNTEPEYKENPLTSVIYYSLIVTQLMVLSMLLYVAYCCGRKTNTV